MDWFSHIRTHTTALADLSQAADPATPVPTCPGWSLADLTWHLLEVQDFWTHIVTKRPAGPETYEEKERPADAELPAGLRDACEGLIAALAAADSSDPAWSWSDDPADHTVAFTHRRQAHEAFVHLADAVAATGSTVPAVDPAFAADGIDEIIALNLSGVPEWATMEATADRVRLSASDVGRTWVVRLLRWSGTSPNTGTTYENEGAVQLEDDHGQEVSVETTAAATELDLWLWGRRPDEVVSVTGDHLVARRLWDLAREATQ